MDRIIVFGGSGFIGKNLVKELAKDYKIVVVTRHKHSTKEQFGSNIKVVRYRRTDLSKITEVVNGSLAIINLAGENVGSRWTKTKMEKIRKSRLDVDSVICRAVLSVEEKPKVVIQGSAIGIYGSSRNTIDINEDTSLGQRGFLTKVAISHEEMFEQLDKITRVVYIRTGMVLGADGGALPKITTLFNYYLGGKLGNGKQWTSWIHIDDQVNAIKFLIENDNCVGPYNLCAPNPVTNKEFTKELGQILGRPTFMSVPSFVLRLILGTMAKEILLSGLRVVPTRLLDDGFKFSFSELTVAFENIFQKK